MQTRTIPPSTADAAFRMIGPFTLKAPLQALADLERHARSSDIAPHRLNHEVCRSIRLETALPPPSRTLCVVATTRQGSVHSPYACLFAHPRNYQGTNCDVQKESYLVATLCQAESRKNLTTPPGAGRAAAGDLRKRRAWAVPARLAEETTAQSLCETFTLTAEQGTNCGFMDARSPPVRRSQPANLHVAARRDLRNSIRRLLHEA